MGSIRLITDPILRPRVAHLRRAAPVAEVAAPVDCVLVSHAHMDHLDPRSIALLAGDEVEVGAVTVRATHAEHDGRRYALGPPAASLGYRIQGDRSVYFAGDTGL